MKKLVIDNILVQYEPRIKRPDACMNTCSMCEYFFDNKTHNHVGFCHVYKEVTPKFESGCKYYQTFETPFDTLDPEPFQPKEGETLHPTYFEQLQLNF